MIDEHPIEKHIYSYNIKYFKDGTVYTHKINVYEYTKIADWILP